MLSAEDLALYQEDGFLLVEEAVTDAEIDRFLRLGGDSLPTGHAQSTLQRHRTDPAWAAFAGHPRLVGWVGQVLGGRPRVLQTMYIPKPPAGPRTPKNGVLLHRDQLYLRADPPRVTACWIAMSDADAGNGSLRVVPGSHRWPSDAGVDRHSDQGLDVELRAPDGRQWTERQPAVRLEELAASLAVPLAVPRGGVVLFDGLLVHGSETNRSTTRERLAFATHYVHEDAWVNRADLQNTVAAEDLIAQVEGISY